MRVTNASLVVFRILNWPYLRNGSSDALHVSFLQGKGFGVGGYRMALYFRFDQIQDGSRPPSWNIRMATYPQPIIRSTSCLVLDLGGRRIDWHYFRWDQTQDVGHNMTRHDRRYAFAKLLWSLALCLFFACFFILLLYDDRDAFSWSNNTITQI